MIYQTTLTTSVTLSGIGLHSGRTITMTLRPADANTGVVFHRREGERVVAIKAISANVIDTRLATVIGREDLSVSTIEHLMAALNSLGIDNLNIDIDGPEVPIMDGSAAPFIEALQQAGITPLAQGRRYLAIRKPITLVDGEKRVSILPSRFFRVTFDIAFDHPSIGIQHRTMKVTADSFRQDIASARTFGFFHEVEFLKANGLARGGSLENAVVVGDEGVLNPEGLRFKDEFVRHKILDIVGDFALTGLPILGHIQAFKAGHDINHRMVEKILAASDCWQVVEFSDSDLQEALPLSESRACVSEMVYSQA